MQISVKLNGETLFNWEGDASEVAKIEKETARIAKAEGYTVEQIAQTAIMSLNRDATLFDHPTMMFILALLLTQPSPDKDHPGHIRDVEACRFAFDIVPGAEKIHVTALASPAEGTA